MGAVANLRPELFDGVVAAVPFVDVVTTMLDDTHPADHQRVRRVGQPQREGVLRLHALLLALRQRRGQGLPAHLLVTTGLHDSQVQYWEPAKWVAKLRALKTDDNLLLLKTNMEAGHGGACGRFQRHKETALMYAFLLELSGKAG